MISNIIKIIGAAVVSVAATVLFVEVSNPVAIEPVSETASGADTAVHSTAVHIAEGSRTIKITGAISLNAVNAAQAVYGLDRQSNKPITILIDSPGGYVDRGNVLIQAINRVKSNVTTVCYGQCSSMAAFIFTHGKQRYMTKSSKLMYHPISISYMSNNIPVDTLVNYAVSLQHKNSIIEKTIADKVGITFREYKELAALELWLAADQAMNNGFAHKIVTLEVNNSEQVMEFRGPMTQQEFLEEGRSNWLRWVYPSEEFVREDDANGDE